MRVLHVSQPVEAGVANVVYSLVADQRRRGFDVHVACPPGPGLAERVQGLGAGHHEWRATRHPSLSARSEIRSLRQITDRVDPDIVVLHSAKAGMAGRLALRRERRTVYVPHAWSFEAVEGAARKAAIAWEVLAGRWTDVVVCVSDDEKRRGVAVGITAPMEVIPNGVQVDAWLTSDSRTARIELGLPDRPTVVCVGRLAPQKGQDLLLESWTVVSAAVPRAQLVLVGDGPLRPALEASAPVSVTFLGAREDINTVLASADVVAVPSRWEGGALVPLEAMAVGRPVVAFASDGMLAALGDTGAVLRVGDTVGMAAVITQWLLNPEVAETAGRAARERALVVADLEHSLKAWNDLLAAVIGRGAQASHPLQIVPVSTVSRLLLSGSMGTADMAQVSGSGWMQQMRTATLSALGMPVWWKDGGRSNSLPALGAPIVIGASNYERLTRAARRPGAGVLGGPGLSIVVTVLNEGSALGRLVDDLLPQLRDGDELVLVDGGSTDGSVATLPANRRLVVKVVPGAGISAGRNHGVRASANEIIVCTDAGCVPGPGFVDGFRKAFTGAPPPSLVSGVYEVTSRNAMERAQALACYPQSTEVRRPTLAVKLYTKAFGTAFDPRFAVGRCVAFSRAAWEAAGGFPEHLATGEDISFGLSIAERGECLATTDAVVGWTQRDGLAATWRMYRGYGRASTDGGNTKLLVRDGSRAIAYFLAPILLTRPVGRWLVGTGAASYLSLPVARAVRGRAGVTALLLLPIALAVKDLGKLSGAVLGLLNAVRRGR